MHLFGKKASTFRKLLIPDLLKFNPWAILLELASSLEQDHAPTVNILTLCLAVENKPPSHPRRLEPSDVKNWSVMEMRESSLC